MADALGQDRDDVLMLPYDHEGINAMLGSPTDTAGETAAVSGFVSRMIAETKPPKTKLDTHPRKTVRTKHKRAKVKFAFSSKAKHVSFECRTDSGGYMSCRSPKRLQLHKGSHTFRVRAISDRGRPGQSERFDLRVIRR